MMSMANEKKNYHLLACLKQVPDERELGMDPETGSLLRANAGSIPNPGDDAALELALQLKEKLAQQDNPTESTALTMGPAAARASLRRALSLGFDRAIQLRDSAFAGSDVLMTAKTLALAIQSLDTAPDMIFCGEASSDGDTGQLPAELSVFLNYAFLPQVTEILSLEGQVLRAMVEMDGIKQEVEVELPVVLQVNAASQTLRFPSFRDRLEANKKPLELWTREDLSGVDEMDLGYTGSPTKIRKMAAPVFHRAGIRLKVEEHPDFLQKLFTAEDPEAYIDELVEAYGGKKFIREEASPLPSASDVPPKEPAMIVVRHEAEDLSYALEFISKLQSAGDFPVELCSVKDASCDNHSDLEALEAQLTANMDRWRVYHNDHILSSMEAAGLLANRAKEVKASLLIFPATDWGRALGPLVAAKLETGMTAAVTELSYHDGAWEQVRPAYGGMVLATVITPDHRPIMMTVQPRVWDVQLKDNRSGVREDYVSEETKSPVRILSSVKADSEELLLDQAKRILVLGGGIPDEESLGAWTDLAARYGYDWGVSRALVMGYLAEHERQIGVSGISVKPEIALLIGAYGTSQTMSGLSQAGRLLAINSDPEAKIFDQVDLGFVGDYHEFLKHITY